MPAYNFKPRFADLVEHGIKRSTIRKYRKDGRDPMPGETLYLFTGMRTKQCRRLLETRCENVTPITITRTGRFLLEGKDISRDEMTAIAQGDGFSGPGDLLLWFAINHGLPFSGLYIQW